MTTTPICEGPIYDCIVQPQFDTLSTEAQKASTMATGSMTHCRPESTDHDHHIVSATTLIHWYLIVMLASPIRAGFPCQIHSRTVQLYHLHILTL